MRLERLRHDRTSSRENAGFVAWGWPGWLGGMLCWVVVLWFTYPTASALYRGEIGPLSPVQWIAQSALYAFVFVPAFVAILYQGWVFFIVLRMTGDQITVGRWFGARRVTYRAASITTWCFVDYRSLDVPDAKSASRLRIDFSDGSWVRLSRYGWNFRGLEAWLRQWAPAAARPVWRLPDDQASARPFVVRDVPSILLGLAGWIMFWMFAVTTALLTIAPPKRAPSPGEVIYNAVMFVVWLVLGPLVAHMTLKDLHVDGPRIRVTRWFGLIRRTYREGDIAWWRVSLDSKPSRWRQPREPSIVIRFVDKAGVVVAGNSANFRLLLEYLRAHALERHDVRRRAKTGWVGARRLVG